MRDGVKVSVAGIALNARAITRGHMLLGIHVTCVRPYDQGSKPSRQSICPMSERPRKQAKQAVDLFLDEDRKPTWDEKLKIEEWERQAEQAVNSSSADEAFVSLRSEAKPPSSAAKCLPPLCLVQAWIRTSRLVRAWILAWIRA